MGKSDFEAAESLRLDPFFKHALGIKQSPSAPRLRQRFDEDAEAIIPLIDAANVEFIASVSAPITALLTGHVALDMDVLAQDNSHTQKEAVSYTYKGYDGYAPIAAHVGSEGWCLSCELRPGSQHAQKEFGYTLERVLPRVWQLTSAPVLVRLDGALDAAVNRRQLAIAATSTTVNNTAGLWWCGSSSAPSTERASCCLPRRSNSKVGRPRCRSPITTRQPFSNSTAATHCASSSTVSSRPIWIWSACPRGSSTPTT